jgi:hypothetical protein
MGNVKKISITHQVTIDPSTRKGATYTGILDLNELKQQLQTHFSMPMASAFPMYKWFHQPHELAVNGYSYEPPNDLPVLKNPIIDKSIGNLLLSHLPGWADLPDKETAATVYSGRATAADFSKIQGGEGNHPGRMYRAIPALNTRLVIAPSTRIRYSFSYALKEFAIADTAYGSLGKLSGCFHDLFHACGMADGSQLDWPAFLTTLHDIAFAKKQPARKLSPDTERLLTTLIKNKEQLIHFLDNAFSPLQNGFKVIDFTGRLNKADYPDNEIWLASPCLFVEEELFEQMRS